MNNEPISVSGNHGPPPRETQEDRSASFQRALRHWMREKVQLELSRGWLTGIALAFFLLTVLALD